jgi:hypothetical protein
MKIEVPITRTVELHVHNYQLNIRRRKDSSEAPSYTIGCVCGNGLVIKSHVVGESSLYTDDKIELTEMLEVAASEQERKHKDWQP